MDDPLDRLNLKAERVVFVFYGYKKLDGGLGRGYVKLAHSLAEAYGDLLANPGVQDAVYIVNDIFVEQDEDGTTLHIELRDLADVVVE